MAGSTILVVDGDLASRNYIATALQKEGHRVLQAASGKEGLIFAWRDRPDIVVADPNLPDLTGEELAARLRSDPRTAKLALIALSRDPSPARQKSCTEAGFNEYLVKSAQAIPTLISTVSMLLMGEQAAVKSGGLLIVFLSAKGGTGTSSLCANFGRSIADHQPDARVVVGDLVLPIGSVAGIVGYREEQNLVTMAAMQPSETTPGFLLSRLPLMEEWRFHLLAGSPDPQHANELAVGRIGELVSGLKSSYDFVLLDLGRSLSRISLPLIEHADLVALILGADMSTVSLTRILWDYLQSKGLQAASMFPILNRAVGLEGLTKAEIEQMLGIAIKTSIPYLGGNFSMANNQHLPYSVKFPRDTASIVLKDTSQQMIDLARRQRTG
jgi:CheY-like chemotaxis protein/MinD-like ATPase involved in chromosome partitioning or flagellar assembly